MTPDPTVPPAKPARRPMRTGHVTTTVTSGGVAMAAVGLFNEVLPAYIPAIHPLSEQGSMNAALLLTAALIGITAWVRRNAPDEGNG